MNDSQTTRSSGLTLLMWVAITVVATLNLALAHNNRVLKAARASETPSSQAVASGHIISRLAGVARNGAFTELLPGADKNTLVITFSSSCPYSRANHDRWLSLSRRIDRRQWTVVWITSDSLNAIERYALDAMLPDPVLAEVPIGTYRALGLDTVPKTIAITRHGVIDRVWDGEFSEDSWKTAEQYFGGV